MYVTLFLVVKRQQTKSLYLNYLFCIDFEQQKKQNYDKNTLNIIIYL